MPEAAITQGWGAPIWETNFSTPGVPDPAWWNRYDGEGHNGNGTRDPERIEVVNGILTLTGLANGSTGGMSHELGQQYGRWEVRMRSYATGGSGSQYHPVLIVWPDSDNWPEDGEYDFYEGDVGDTQAGAWIHYPHDPGPVQQVGPHKKTVSGGIAEWHIYAIDWQSTGITGYIDGEYWFGPLKGGANSTRENIQAMPSGHLTIQLDAFHGDSGYRAAKMEIDWVKIYDNATSGGTGTITGAGGIEAPNQGGPGQVAFPVVGNRFRMYMTNTASDLSGATGSITWAQTGGSVVRKLDLTRAGANAAVTVAETSTANPRDVLLGKWISPPMTSSGVVKGGILITTSIFENDAAADIVRAYSMNVVSNDGTVVRGTLLSGSNNTELQTAGWGAGLLVPNPTEVVCQVGDRISLEVGYQARNAVATSYSATLRYGGTSGDLEHNDDPSLGTTRSPSVTFSDPAVERLFRGQTLLVGSVGTSEAFGTAAVSLPPTQALTASSIASAQAFGTTVVRSEAYPILTESFGGEAFGVLSVNQTILVPTGIPSEESVTSPTRVIRTGDVFPAGIASAEAIGALAALHPETLVPEGIASSELFGLTEVENPNRVLYPFGISAPEDWGVPTLRQRLRTTSIDSAESFGYRKLTVKCGKWKLRNPTRVERHRLGGPWNVIYVTNVIGLTVYGTGQTLITQENPRADDLDSAQYVWRGGHDNITTDQAIRDLWVANGYDVEMSY